MASFRRRWMPTLAALVALIGGLATGFAPPGTAASGAWSVAPYTAPNGTFGLGLQDASCLSASWCMAVSGEGYARWDGTAWTYTATSTAIDASFDLRSLSCTSPTWCVAVGTTFTGIGFEIDSWDGTTWSPMAATGPSTRDNYLFSVSCASAHFCVAVGWSAGANAQGQSHTNIIETWDGTSWALTSAPADPSGASGLSSVSCTSAGFCMAVGQGSITQSPGAAMAYTFDGEAWSELAPPNATNLSAVACLTATTCEAVGARGSVLVGESWNGSTWTAKTVSTPAGLAGLTDISCLSATSCFAAGTKGVDTAPQGMVEHYTGTSWTLVSTPASPSLTGISCVSATACVATGGAVIETNYQPGGAKTPKITAVTPSVTEVGGGTVTATAKITGPAGGGTVSFGVFVERSPITPICSSVPVAKVGSLYEASCTIAGLDSGMGGLDKAYEIEAAYTGTGLYLPSETGLESIDVLNPHAAATQDLGAVPAYKFLSVKILTPLRSPHCTVGLGALPPGLHLAPTCVVSGTPTAPGTNEFDVIVTGVTGSPSRSETQVWDVHSIVTPLTITPVTTQEYGLDVAAHQTFTATAGKAPLTWSVASGTLPPGMTLSSGGVLSGAGTQAGVYTVDVAVHDVAVPVAQTATMPVTITVDPMSVQTLSVPSGNVGRLYPSTQFQEYGGKPGYRWAVVAGTIPPGLRFSTTGTLGGTPTSAGTFTFTVEVTDSATPADTATGPVTVVIVG